MKAKIRRQLQRQAEQERKQYGLPVLDMKKLLQVPAVRDAVLNTAKRAEKRREEGDR